MEYIDKEGALIRRSDSETEVYRGDGRWERYGSAGWLHGDPITAERAQEMMAHVDSYIKSTSQALAS